MKRNWKLLLVTLAILIKNSSLRAQNTYMQWDSLYEGSYQITYSQKVGDRVLLGTVLDKATKPAIVPGGNGLNPINVWMLGSQKMESFQTNWSGDPMDPLNVYKFSENIYFINDGIKMYMAAVDFEAKTINYNLIHQGKKSDSVLLGGVYFSTGNEVYFGSSSKGNWLNEFDSTGNHVRDYFIDETSMNINYMRDIVKFNDTVWISYDYAGGLSDGSGLCYLDKTTGKVTKVRLKPFWANNSGCRIKVVNGHFYLISDPGKFDFRPTLFEYQSGVWKTLIIGCVMPEPGKIRVMQNAYYYNGDTIRRAYGSENYEFDHSTVKVGNIINDDWRLDPSKVNFSSEFQPGFWARHNIMPYVEFIYEYNGHVYGFGPHIVAELVQKTNSVNYLNLPKIDAYPNPTTGNVQVSGIKKPENYIITNVAGQTVTSGITMGEIDLSNITPGIYVLNITGFKPVKIIRE